VPPAGADGAPASSLAGAAASAASSSGDGDEAAAVPFADRFPPGGMRGAWMEDVVAVLSDALRTVVQATRHRVERRETLTADERERDAEEELTQARGGDDDGGEDQGDESDDDPIASGKARLKRNAVLGPDGEPISHWLYRVSDPRWCRDHASPALGPPAPSRPRRAATPLPLGFPPRSSTAWTSPSTARSAARPCGALATSSGTSTAPSTPRQ